MMNGPTNPSAPSRTGPSARKVDSFCPNSTAHRPALIRVGWAVVWLISELVARITTALILPTVRWYLDNFAIAYRRLWYWARAVSCVDGYCPTEGVEFEFGELYGDGPYEDVDVVTPVAGFGGSSVDPRTAPVAVYLHGGGFVACTSQCLLHSIPIPVARNGYRVYSINYPLAPENNFPDPVIATVRALAYIKAEAQVDSVVIMGDSAGGAVASTVTAVLSAPGLYEQLVEDVQARPGGPGWRVMPAKADLPRITKLVSIYGVMDWKGWSDECDPITGENPEMRWNDHIGAAVLRFCLHCYSPEKSTLQGRCLLSDFTDEELADFPPTLLLCGTWDPLVHGNRDMYRRLKALGRTVELEEYNSLLSHRYSTRSNAHFESDSLRQGDSWPAYQALSRFVLGRDPVGPSEWPKSQTLDPTLPFAIFLALALLPTVFLIVIAGKLHALDPFQSLRKATVHHHTN